MDLNKLNQIAIKIARRIMAYPMVYEYIHGIKFYIFKESGVEHHEPHVHVEEDGIRIPFSLRNGLPLNTTKKLKHQKEVLDFLKNTSNRRRLLRMFKKYQEGKGKNPPFLIDPNLDF